MFDEHEIEVCLRDYRNCGKYMLAIDWGDEGTICTAWNDMKSLRNHVDMMTSRTREQIRIYDLKEGEMDIVSEIKGFYEKAIAIRDYLDEHRDELTLNQLNNVIQGLDSVVGISSEAYDVTLKSVKSLGDMFDYMD